MKNVAFPTTIFDGFLTYPDEVKEFALKQNYKVSSDGKWPGKRSEPLNEICPIFFKSLINKALYIFYNSKTCSFNWQADASFQLVSSQYEKGWVHSDSSASCVTGIIYLSKNQKNSGTTLYKPKNSLDCVIKHEKEKRKSNLNLISASEYRDENNKQFEPSITVDSQYNRLLMFDSHLYHAANSFLSCTEEERLTIVFFIYFLNVHNDLYPVIRAETSI